MSELIAGIPAGSILAHHTFNCALTTRGGVCDCLPEDVQTAGPLVEASEPEVESQD